MKQMLTKENEIINAAEKVNNVTVFVIADEKISRFCLLPGAKHWEEFKNVGFTPNDSDLLKEQIRSIIDVGERVELAVKGDNIKFAVYGELGVSKKRRFCTAWQIDAGTDHARFISAYQKGR